MKNCLLDKAWDRRVYLLSINVKLPVVISAKFQSGRGSSHHLTLIGNLVLLYIPCLLSVNLIFFGFFLRVSGLRVVFTMVQFFHDGGLRHRETSPLICSANQLTGFYMAGTFIMKELIPNGEGSVPLPSLMNNYQTFYSFISNLSFG